MITYLNTLEPEQVEQRLRALHYLVMLIANRRPSEEHQELIDLVNQQSNEMEVETMAKTMVEVYIEQGIEQGKAEGIEQGAIQAKREMILKLLDIHIGDIPDTVSRKVSRMRSLSRLDSLLEQVATAQSLEDIQWN